MFELLAWVQISLSAGSFSGRNFPLYYCYRDSVLNVVYMRFERGLLAVYASGRLLSRSDYHIRPKFEARFMDGKVSSET